MKFCFNAGEVLREYCFWRKEEKVMMASPSAGSISSLPEEIMFEILTRLPVKSLCRFRCVSCGWLSIISDPQFVEAHFTRSLADPKLLILITVHSAIWGKEEHFFVADYPEQGQWNILTTFSEGIFSERRMHDLSRSCGGLILSHDSGNGIIRIINPSTRESAPFDLGSAHHLKPKSLFWLTSASFGFDPVDRNHKILSSGKLSALYDYEMGWRKISSLPRFKVDTSYPYVCINGQIYYIGWLPKSDEARCLIIFGVRSESFLIIPLPHPMMNFISCAGTSFIEYKGRLAILDYSSSVGLPRREILLWILEGINGPFWSCKRIPVPLDLVERSPEHDLFFIGSLRGGAELVFLPYYSDFSYLFFYNLEDYSHRKVDVHGILDYASELGFNISVCDHIESLRPVT